MASVILTVEVDFDNNENWKAVDIFTDESLDVEEAKAMAKRTCDRLVKQGLLPQQVRISTSYFSRKTGNKNL